MHGCIQGLKVALYCIQNLVYPPSEAITASQRSLIPSIRELSCSSVIAS